VTIAKSYGFHLWSQKKTIRATVLQLKQHGERNKSMIDNFENVNFTTGNIFGEESRPNLVNKKISILLCIPSIKLNKMQTFNIVKYVLKDHLFCQQ